MSSNKALVGVVMGSLSDKSVMDGCLQVLDEFEIPYEAKVLSAHRSPELTRQYAMSAAERGIEIIVAGAGWAAHLAGFMAAHTLLPVIGVPIDSSPHQGMDALLSTVQMPPGIPVATMAVGSGGAKNAGILAAQILGLKYPAIGEQVKCYRDQLMEKAGENVDAWKAGSRP